MADDNKEKVGEPANNVLEKIDSKIKELKELEAKIDSKKSEVESILARQMLSGQSSAGQASPPQPTPEQLKKKGAVEFWKGTGLDKAINKYG
jgi:hypothetical protein